MIGLSDGGGGGGGLVDNSDNDLKMLTLGIKHQKKKIGHSPLYIASLLLLATEDNVPFV